jgi:glycosyltransferase involved in cell wall biosynthesis
MEGLQLLTHDDWNKIDKVQICGGGPLENAVFSKCAKLKDAGHPLVVRGYLNKMDALELLMWADYLIIPSRIESIPLIFSDAMQTNCLVIATPVGDLPRLINSYNTGIIASNVSARAIQLAIREAVLKSPDSYAHSFKNVRQVFDLQQAAINLLYALNVKVDRSKTEKIR